MSTVERASVRYLLHGGMAVTARSYCLGAYHAKLLIYAITSIHATIVIHAIPAIYAMVLIYATAHSRHGQVNTDISVERFRRTEWELHSLLAVIRNRWNTLHAFLRTDRLHLQKRGRQSLKKFIQSNVV
jgi:hypothetical protein